VVEVGYGVVRDETVREWRQGCWRLRLRTGVEGKVGMGLKVVVRCVLGELWWGTTIVASYTITHHIPCLGVCDVTRVNLRARNTAMRDVIHSTCFNPSKMHVHQSATALEHQLRSRVPPYWQHVEAPGSASDSQNQSSNDDGDYQN